MGSLFLWCYYGISQEFLKHFAQEDASECVCCSPLTELRSKLGWATKLSLLRIKRGEGVPFLAPWVMKHSSLSPCGSSLQFALPVPSFSLLCDTSAGLAFICVTNLAMPQLSFVWVSKVRSSSPCVIFWRNSRLCQMSTASMRTLCRLRQMRLQGKGIPLLLPM